MASVTIDTISACSGGDHIEVGLTIDGQTKTVTLSMQTIKEIFDTEESIESRLICRLKSYLRENNLEFASLSAIKQNLLGKTVHV